MYIAYQNPSRGGEIAYFIKELPNNGGFQWGPKETAKNFPILMAATAGMNHMLQLHPEFAGKLFVVN